MKPNLSDLKKRWQMRGHFVLLACLFGIAHTQAPLYKSAGNHNTKFLHGLAAAGHGFLSEDWMANTLNPLPVFSYLVKTGYQYVHSEYIFYICYLLIFGIYLSSTIRIVDSIYKIKKTKLKYLVYLTAFIFIHTVNIEIFDFDTAWHLHSGVAGQYILDLEFQPASFGALILLSICHFLDRKLFLSIFFLCLAATIHPAYLLSAAVLTFCYMFQTLIEEKNPGKAILLGGWAFVLVLPTLLYTSLTFSATSPEIWQQANDLITQVRIPHHSIPQVWLADGTAYLQALVVVGAIYAVRDTKLFALLCFPFLSAVVLTGVQVLFHNNTFAFIAPWRLSVFLVPLSTYLILGGLVDGLFRRYCDRINTHQTLIARLSLATLSLLVSIGAVNQVGMFLHQDRTIPMMNFIKQTRQAGEVYLVPPDSRQIRKFRLYTGAPIFINHKSHPYKDVEVLEWDKRLQLARQFYEDTDNRCQLLQTLSIRYGITHTVLEQPKIDTNCEIWERLYSDEHYMVYRIKRRDRESPANRILK